MKVGSVVILKTPLLGNDAGSMGVVYELYPDFDQPDKKGSSIIFENGDYDGFSYYEQQRYVKEVGFNSSVADYQFQNVLNVSRDFDQFVFHKNHKQEPHMGFEEEYKQTILDGKEELKKNSAIHDVYDTDELQRDFEVQSFGSPFVIVKRKSDGFLGSLQFINFPRLYFNFKKHE